MSRAAVAILSTQNLLHNLNVIKERVKPAKVIAIVKANAYGHGIRSVGLKLQNQADMLGVASIDEALTLRKVGVTTPIMLNQGIHEAAELPIAAAEKFHVVFNNETQLKWLNDSQLNQPITAWLKINTGLTRLGFNVSDAKEVYHQLEDHPLTEKPVRIMSHFSCADQKEHPLNAQQITLFNEFIQDHKTEYSLCNSAGIMTFPDCFYDYVRPGIMLYGVSPFKGKTCEDLGLKPVMTVKSNLISVQRHAKGSSLGYGARYTLSNDTLVGIIAFGYGDGYPVSAPDGTYVLINQIKCPLIGKVSMDMMAVDLSNCPDAQVGDSVTLWGDDLPIETLAESSSSIVWNILTSVQNRVKFIWN